MRALAAQTAEGSDEGTWTESSGVRLGDGADYIGRSVPSRSYPSESTESLSQRKRLPPY